MEERHTARIWLEDYAARRGISVEDIGVAPIVLVTWIRGIFDILVEATGATPAQYWHKSPLSHGQIQGQPVSVLLSQIGAPATVGALEELAACGANAIMGFGDAGSLQPDIGFGSIVLPTEAVIDEGTSRHYPTGSLVPRPDKRLSETLRSAAAREAVDVHEGPVWTTDAVYRELKTVIQDHAQRGVFVVDMETSAMYTWGEFRSIPVCNMLIVSDEVWADWRAGMHTSEYLDARKKVVAVAMRGVAALS